MEVQNSIHMKKKNVGLMTGLEKEMNQGRKREVLYDGSLLNLVWCGNVLLLAKKKQVGDIVS